jgi:hypothetical protein
MWDRPPGLSAADVRGAGRRNHSCPPKYCSTTPSDLGALDRFCGAGCPNLRPIGGALWARPAAGIFRAQGEAPAQFAACRDAPGIRMRNSNMLFARGKRLILACFLVSILCCPSCKAGDSPTLEPTIPEPRQSLDAVEQEYILGSGGQPAFQDWMSTLAADWKQNRSPRKTFALVPSSPLPSSVEYRYNPVLLTLLAGIESHNYARDDARWESIELLPAEGQRSPYYTRPVSLHFWPGSPQNSRLFVVCGSSYSTWKLGSWTNKTAAAIRNAFPSAHLIVLEGFLTPHFLRARPLFPELSGAEAANDIYQRVRGYLRSLQERGKIPKDIQAGLIGFSGGANLALSILSADAAINSGAPLFARGALAYSPIVDLSTTFAILDQSSRKILDSGFPASRGLTTIHGAIQMLLHGYTAGNVPAFISLLSTQMENNGRSQDIVKRFYREFTIVDLANLMRAGYVTDVAGSKDPERGYEAYYRDGVFPLHQKRLGLHSDVTFSSYTNLGNLTSSIKVPVYVVFAQDDPVLALSTIVPAPHPEVALTLAALRRRGNFRVFSPDRGGHLGFILDSRFLLGTIRGFFN